MMTTPRRYKTRTTIRGLCTPITLSRSWIWHWFFLCLWWLLRDDTKRVRHVISRQLIPNKRVFNYAISSLLNPFAQFAYTEVWSESGSRFCKLWKTNLSDGCFWSDTSHVSKIRVSVLPLPSFLYLPSFSVPGCPALKPATWSGKHSAWLPNGFGALWHEK